MSRFRRLFVNVASGYVSLGANALYTLASVPVALHYLSKEEFGLWALIGAIGVYLNLIDAGMSGSIARLLIDHKDEPDRGGYGSLIQTGWLVLTALGGLVFLLAFALAPLVSQLLAIPPNLEHDFTGLLRWQGAALGLSFALRIFNHILQAHQRIDMTNYGQVIIFVVSFILLCLFFHAGFGVFSLVWAGVISVLVSNLALGLACLKFRLFPRQGAWGRASWGRFLEVFNFAKDFFLVAVGGTIILSSQTLIITRRVGLDAEARLAEVAAWYVGTRAFGMVSQAIWRIMAYALPAFSEMIVRGERVRLRGRFQDIIVLSGSLSVFAAIALACCNSPFVSLYSHGKVAWSSHYDVLLGVWLVLLTQVSCNSSLVLGTKKVGLMQYVYFAEGAVFVLLAWFASAWGGLEALIGCSVLCTSTMTFAYGLFRSSRYFGISASEIISGWFAPAGKVLALFGPAALAAWLLVQALCSGGASSFQAPSVLISLVRLGLMGGFCGTVGLAIVVRYGLPPALQQELLGRTPKAMSPILRRVVRFAP